MEFDQLIAPVPRADFLQKYWNISFVRMPGGSDRFANLFSWDELNAVLEQHRLAPPRLRLFQDGRPIDPARYVLGPHMGVPRLDPGGLAACLAQGATLVLNDAHELAPRIRDLMHQFQDVLRVHAYGNLYAAWHSQKAFDMHWDAQDSFVLQLSGRKHWKVYKPTRVHPLENDVEAPTPPVAEPVWEGVMREGDLLYIPRGWWHAVFPLNEPSLHLTVSLAPPKGIDFLEWAVSKLRYHAEVRADLPMLMGTEAQAAHAQHLKTFLEEAVSDRGMAEFLGRWDTNISPSPRIRLPNSPYEQLGEFDSDSRIRLAGQHSLFLTAQGDHFEFQAAGRLWSVPPALAPSLKQLHNVRDHTVAELSVLLTDDTARGDLLKSLAVLARAGVILVEKAR